MHAFYTLINWGARTKIPEDAGDFRLLSPRAANALRQLPERNRFFKGLASWIGFRQMRIDYEPEARTDGRTTWNMRRLIGLSLNGLTAFSVAPLRFATMLGTVLALIAFVYGLQIVYETLVYGENVPGYPSLFVGIMVLGGVQLIMLGVLGEYIGKILEEIKGRPVYFVAEHDVKLRRRRHARRERCPRRGRMSETTPLHIWLCADDYGISPAVSAAIRDLIARRRLNATSVMVGAPSFSPAEADALRRSRRNARRDRAACDIDWAVPAA